MPFPELRVLMLEVSVSAHGVPVTVTRPVPNDIPIVTTGVWMPPARRAATDEVYEVGTELHRREPTRKVMAIQKSAIAAVPLGTLIAAAEQPAGAVTNWRVDGYERLEGDHTRVVLVPADSEA